jgi:CubicO group peptidase (beta-lactamase class C family)
MMAIDIQGSCDAKFTRVKDAFAAGFESGDEVGASVAITLDGQPVVDLWAGHANKEKTRPWTRDTIANAYSTTKGLIAICAHRLVDQGKLDLDAPVARYWPDFAQAGKDEIPVRFLLSHRAGLPAVRPLLPQEALFDWDMMCTALAAQEPWWAPGMKHGYHAITYGWLIGEVIRRITGKSPGTFFRDELVEPLGLDAYIGLAPEHDARTANLIAAPPPPPGQPNIYAEILSNPESMLARAFANPPVMAQPGLVNSRAWRAAELPAANGHTTARSLARLYGALSRGGEVDGYRVLTPESIVRCHSEQSRGMDAVLPIVTRFGLGFMMSLPGAELGPNPRAFGHPGAGGSLGYADPDAKVGFGYVMNRMGMSILVDARVKRLIDALYQSL